MPRRDGTGPMGIGPTGRGLGYCTTGRFANSRMGLGLGRRGGFGCGLGLGYRQNVGVNYAAPVSEKELLQEEKQALENRLNAINAELESE